ncbi:MAG TPA: TolC family protein [Chthoniobacterales bacterium]|jgi:outer membrane protein TolC
MKTLFSLLVSLFLVLPGVAARGRAASASVDAVVRQVLADNPQLKSARLKWEAMKERPHIAGSLPDPTLSYGYFFDNVETRVGAQNQRVGLSQKIPFPGKLSLAAKRARQEALQSFWQYQTLARELIMRAKLAYYDLYRVDETRRVLREQVDLYEQTFQSARSKYEAGTVQQQDVLKAQLSSAEIEKRLLELLQLREAAQARLNALRNLPAETPIETSAHFDFDLPLTLERATALAAQYRQDLREANVAIERNETSLALARKDRLPDFTVGADYAQVNPNIFSNPPDNGHDAVVGSISVNVPIWFGKLNAEEREARKNLAASREAQQNVANNVGADVRDAWFQFTTAREQVELYRQNLLPQAQQTYDASRAAYEAAKTSLIDFLDTERSLLNFRLGLINSETDLAKSLAMLERAIGLDLRAAQRVQITKEERFSK